MVQLYVFLTLSFSFALVVGLVVFFTVPTRGLVLAETVGAGAILFGGWGAWRVRRTPVAGNALIRVAHAENVVGLAMSDDEARALAQATLRKAPFVRPATLRREDGRLTAKTRPSRKSFGERLSLQIESKGSRTTNVRIVSHSLLFTTVIDHGKNAENVELIRRALMKNE
jgi:hypothetical protein